MSSWARPAGCSTDQTERIVLTADKADMVFDAERCEATPLFGALLFELRLPVQIVHHCIPPTIL